MELEHQRISDYFGENIAFTKNLDFRSIDFDVGATGSVTTPFGVSIPFEITAFEPGRRWAWKVLGLPATDHTVTQIGPDRCEVGFGVPLLARPYLVVCDRALDRLDRMASSARAATT